jgi:glycosyltransferase involved in cell wall biosynthesis
MTKKKILVIGQTPPPYGGQAVMIESMLKGGYKDISFFHVRMAFSKEMNEVGKLNFYKLFHLVEMVCQILYVRFRHNVHILYFPPTGEDRMSFYRDAFILTLTRPFFRKTCFHFHAGGISDLYPSLDFFSKILFRRSYYYADLGIRLSEESPQDCFKLKIPSERIIPNGIDDHYLGRPERNSYPVKCSILFVGLLTESKGLLIALDACRILKSRAIDFNFNVMGKFESAEFEIKVKNKVAQDSLQHQVSFLGVMTGEAKFQYYLKANIFCFPTFFESENFPVVLLEAASFALPVVSSQWRGIPSIIQEGENGFLSPVKDYHHMAERLQLLIEQPELRKKMGETNRRIYLEKYSLNKFHENMEEAFHSL